MVMITERNYFDNTDSASESMLNGGELRNRSAYRHARLSSNQRDVKLRELGLGST